MSRNMTETEARAFVRSKHPNAVCKLESTGEYGSANVVRDVPGGKALCPPTDSKSMAWQKAAEALGGGRIGDARRAGLHRALDAVLDKY